MTTIIPDVAVRSVLPSGGGLGDAIGCDVAAGSGHVLDHDRLAERFGEPIGDQARHDIGGAAGRESGQHADRLVGIVCLRECAARGEERAERNDKTEGRLHRRMLQ